MKHAIKHFEKIVFVLFAVAVVILVRARLPYAPPAPGNIIFKRAQYTIVDRMHLAVAFRAPAKCQREKSDWLVTRFSTIRMDGWKFVFIADPLNRKWRLWSKSCAQYELIALRN